MTDSALLKHIGAFVKHHRMEQNRTQADVATAADISRSTLSLLERGGTVTLSTLVRVLRILDQLHTMSAFETPHDISPLVLARLERRKRQRARGRANDSANP